MLVWVIFRICWDFYTQQSRECTHSGAENKKTSSEKRLQGLLMREESELTGRLWVNHITTLYTCGGQKTLQNAWDVEPWSSWATEAAEHPYSWVKAGSAQRECSINYYILDTGFRSEQVKHKLWVNHLNMSWLWTISYLSFIKHVCSFTCIHCV